MKKVDVAVVGGGIHGVGVAQAAVAAGHSVTLFEKSALAHGTSSRSSKLIHGGLRYLESYEFGLVRESLRERALMLELAPELVKLRPFHIPVFRSTRRRPIVIRAGLSLYAVLGGLSSAARFEKVPRDGWDDLDGLVTDDLLAVYCYNDAQTDDAVLTRAIMQSAIKLGAELEMPATVTSMTLTPEGCRLQFESAGRQEEIEARVAVNAAGPWVNRVLSTVEPEVARRRIELTQGTHIILEGVVKQGIYYVEAPRDGRAVFVMPWYGKTMVGTTETKFTGDPEDTAPLRTEISYLTNVLNRYFPRYAAGPESVIDAFAGLRVLPAGSGHAFHRTRETMLDPDRPKKQGAPRLLSIYGGKLTGWRATAEKVMERIAPALPERRAVADTAKIRLDPPE